MINKQITRDVTTIDKERLLRELRAILKTRQFDFYLRLDPMGMPMLLLAGTREKHDEAGQIVMAYLEERRIPAICLMDIEQNNLYPDSPIWTSIQLFVILDLLRYEDNCGLSPEQMDALMKEFRIDFC